MAKATVTSKGQITIPLAIRERLSLGPGTVLEFDETSEHLEASKAVDIERMRAIIGSADDVLAGKSTSEWLEDIRGAVALPARGGTK